MELGQGSQGSAAIPAPARAQGAPHWLLFIYTAPTLGYYNQLFIFEGFFPVWRVWCVRIQALTPRTELGQAVPTHSVIYQGF